MKPYWLAKSDHPITRSRAITRLVLACSLLLAIGCHGVGGQTGAPTQENQASQNLPFSGNQALVVPKGTAIYVRLEHTISSSTAQPGDSFSAVLDEPLEIEGQTVVPQGTKISGHVVAARESGRLHNAGYLRLTLSSLNLNGKEVPLQTSSIFVRGGSYRNRNLAYVGGGAGGGALLGALVGGGKGALIGSAIGAAGGTTAAYATGKKEVGFTAERRIGFRLAEPLSVG
ncbi:MAG TPA: hypothetical protein VG759_18165 [Candidatus Angelobacter sp.]|nr:hypothetical protein [Candidatus Angelobacter sp.]